MQVSEWIGSLVFQILLFPLYVIQPGSFMFVNFRNGHSRFNQNSKIEVAVRSGLSPCTRINNENGIDILNGRKIIPYQLSGILVQFCRKKGLSRH